MTDDERKKVVDRVSDMMIDFIEVLAVERAQLKGIPIEQATDELILTLWNVVCRQKKEKSS